ncbi:FadR/GntR family transcriptional regulator [Novosphingobium resinovorum]|uniref:FadR/GntR family transcriptional regulator n=1 Tax=Novosphingobium resinovorum TaxID=158500 RepID=UPI002ED03EE0|nr:FCD domain-containing protein [Novosphingobium resinovorum]
MSTRPVEIGGSLVDLAVQAVRNHIRDHDLKVGDSLPGEGQFATSLGVSRAVMREAFGALAALRLLDVGNGRRARVGAIDGSVMGASLEHAVTTSQISVADVWDVRRTLEVRIAALAAERRSAEQAEQILALAEAMVRDQGDMARVTAHDTAFHQVLAAATGNVLFAQIVRSFAPQMEVAVPKAWETRHAQEEKAGILSLHRRIARAIADGDSGNAAAAMEAHFDASIGDHLR